MLFWECRRLALDMLLSGVDIIYDIFGGCCAVEARACPRESEDVD